MNVLTWSYHNYLVTVTMSSYCHINLDSVQLQFFLLFLLSLSLNNILFLLHYHHTLTVNIIPLPYCPYYNTNYKEMSSLSHGVTTVDTYLNITLLKQKVSLTNSWSRIYEINTLNHVLKVLQHN